MIGNAAEDLAIDTDPLDKQEKLKSNECDGELGTGAAAEVMEVDVFENQGLTVSSLFSSEGNSTGKNFRCCKSKVIMCSLLMLSSIVRTGRGEHKLNSKFFGCRSEK